MSPASSTGVDGVDASDFHSRAATIDPGIDRALTKVSLSASPRITAPPPSGLTSATRPSSVPMIASRYYLAMARTANLTNRDRKGLRCSRDAKVQSFALTEQTRRNPEMLGEHEHIVGTSG